MKWLTRDALTADSSVPEGAGLLKFATVERDTILNESRTVRVVCSTSAPDREKDVITQTGWKLRNYQNNPVVLFGHDYRSLPVGKATSLTIDGDRLLMETEFATAEENPFADVCYKLVKGGYLNAVSVGFRPIKLNWNDERKGYDFLEQELLEISWVPVPAHPMALVEAKEAGISLSLLKQWHDELGEQLTAVEPEPERKTLTSGNNTFVLPEGAKVDSLTIGDFSKTLVNGGTGALDDPEQKAEIEATVADTADKIAGLVKQGRVLSAANETKIRSAVTALSEVLSALETVSDDGKANTQEVHKENTAETLDSLDLEDDTDDITLSAADIAAIRALVRDSVTAHLTPYTGRVV